MFSWPDLTEQPKDDTTLRREQIKLRVAEIDATVDAMKKLASGDCPARYSMEAPDFDWSRWKAVDVEKPVIVGHSLGGSAAVSQF